MNQDFLVRRALGVGAALEPRVLGRTRDMKHPAYHPNAVVGLIRLDEPVRGHWFSLAKKAAALSRISCSSRRMRFSRRSRAASSKDTGFEGAEIPPRVPSGTSSPRSEWLSGRCRGPCRVNGYPDPHFVGFQRA